ncbi:hypothetical protein B0T22DRAFT_461969 [Podospora appendiculata]|uniref:Uncharacterized protein n=1 Tax=Podospora appendiculata TaxID=314037 RepID=A0AAE0XC70_9PEZI|nr:hypothetical protein B0T22DRAFT_461969 [Podospora appendiculata]
MAQACLMFGFHQADWYTRVCACMDYRRPWGGLVSVELSHSSWAAVKDGEEVRCEFFDGNDTSTLTQPLAPQFPSVSGPWNSNRQPVESSHNQSDFTPLTAESRDVSKEWDPRDNDWSENSSLGDWNTGNGDKSKIVSWDFRAPTPTYTNPPDIFRSPPLSPPRWAETRQPTTPRMAGAWVTDASSLGSPRSDTKTTDDDNWSPCPSNSSPRPRSVSSQVASAWESPKPADNKFTKQTSKSTGETGSWDNERAPTPCDPADWNWKKPSDETSNKVENWDSGNFGKSTAGERSAEWGVSWDRLDEGSNASLDIPRGSHDKHNSKPPLRSTAPTNCIDCHGSGKCSDCTACGCTRNRDICLRCRECWCGGKRVCLQCDGHGTVREQAKVENWEPW